MEQPRYCDGTEGEKARSKENPEVQQAVVPNHDGADTALHGADSREDSGHSHRDDESVDPPSEWSETSNAPRRHLGFWQIFSLIINSIVGTGIFTQPGYVLFLTKSKSIALSLWAIGGVYTAITMLVFVEYGIALPFNGGPMVYLDECFDRPRLLALTIFAIHRILVSTSESNCWTLALNLLSLANPTTPVTSFSDGLISLVSVLVIAVVSLLIYFLLPLCFFLNIPLAAFKLVLMLVVSMGGLIALQGQDEGQKDFSHAQPGFDSLSTARAMVYVIFSYQGFINVNCIAGEVKHIERNLKYASAASIILITCLYMFVTTVLYVVLDYASLTDEQGRDDAVVVLIEKSFGSATGIQVAIAISGFATLLVQVYTLARVKQAIAWRRIIPFHEFFGRQSPFDSPGGALLLHGVFTAIPLVALRNTNPAVRSFTIGIYSWGHQLIMAFIGLGLFRLKKCMVRTYTDWHFSILKHRSTLYVVALVFILSNLVILVMTAIPYGKGGVPPWGWPIVTAVVISAATIYWGVLRLLMVPCGSTTLGSSIGFEPRFHDMREQSESSGLRYLIWEAENEGSPRFVTYKITGPIKKLRDGYVAVVDYTFKRLGEGSDV